MKRISKMAMSALLGIAVMLACGGALAENAKNAPESCRSYNALPAKARVSLASGYLEGIQAAVDKEMSDILVPPKHPDHPIWWALPKGELTPGRLQTSLAAFCKSRINERRQLSEAFRAIAARKSGSPRISLPLSDGPSEAWRTVLAKSRLRCSDYLSISDMERTHLIYGYYLGASAMSVILKTPPELSLMVWPDSTYQDVKSRVDEACKGPRYVNSTIRDVLWLTTAEMGVEKRLADAK